LKQYLHCVDALADKEIVEVWNYVCNDEDEWKGQTR
jgi:hypothetical protein